MSDIADIVGEDQIDRDIKQGLHARPALESVNYNAKKKKISPEAKRIAGAIIVTGGLLLAGLTYKGMSYEVQPNMTISHFARGHDIPTPTLMIRNGIEYPEQLRAGSTFYVYHPGFRGILENVHDSFKRIIDK